MVYSPDWEIDVNPSDADSECDTVDWGDADLETIGDYVQEEKDD